MKLAEALNIRADLKKKILQLKERLLRNSKVQEGEEPSENPENLLLELNSNLSELEILIKKINRTNCKTFYGDKTITDLIAERDVLALNLSVKREFLKEASEKIDRYSNTEVKILSTVNISEKQKEIDKLSKILRETDMKIQELNWITELEKKKKRYLSE